MTTLTDIRNQIVRHLLDQSTFLFPRDLDKIKLPEELSGEKESIIIAAMKNLENTKIVEQVNNKETGKMVGWILQNPLESYPQTVTISGGLAGEIADLLNTFVESQSDDGEKKNICDRFNLTEDDIGALLAIMHDMMEDIMEEHKE